MNRAINSTLEHIRDSLEASLLSEAESFLLAEALDLHESANELASLLDSLGYAFNGENVEDFIEAVEAFMESDEFSELDEDMKGKVKAGFKMVFGKLVKLKNKGKELVKAHGKDVAKRALGAVTAVALAAGAAGAHGGHHGGGHGGGGHHGGDAPHSTSVKGDHGGGHAGPHSGGHKGHDPEPEHQHFKKPKFSRDAVATSYDKNMKAKKPTFPGIG